LNRLRRIILGAWCCGLALSGATAVEITRISATKEAIIIYGATDREWVGIAELEPYQSTNDLPLAPVVAEFQSRKHFKATLPRWDGARDRLYSGFVAFTKTNGTQTPQGAIHFVEDMRGVSKYDEPFPHAASKKGLQVQMVDDAIALGVKHAALNLNLSGMVDLTGETNSFPWQSDGVTYYFKRGFVEDLDGRVKRLSDAGMVVMFILLCYQTPDEAINRVMLHPHYSPKAPHQLSAFNTVTPDGLRWFVACIEFLAERYSQPGHPHGRAVNFIAGNEVNAHWEWCNLGEATMEQFAEDYLRTVRVCNTAVRKFSANARVYVCLEHHWNIQYDGPLKSFRGRDFIDYFNQRARAGGDFDWNLAFHPYPEDLTEPRTWNDKTATTNVNTPRITFKNLEMLPAYFNRAELLYHGRRRRIILSEQGFNSPKNPNGELWQAAGYCYAYYKTARLDGIDSFILHRHVDHRDEGGLNLGLWRRNESSASPSEPTGKKMICEVFRMADTPEWRKAFAFALPIIGIKSWDELNVKAPKLR
jgi:hypothetical protein